jgi:hypothetical protein
MNAVWRQAEGVLRGRTGARDWWLALGCGLTYGAVMGSFGGRGLQAVYSALKVPLLLAATVGLSLPSFFMLNTLRGLRGDFAAVVRAVVASQAGLTVILVAMAPLTAFWYASSTDYQAAILFNGLMFGVASAGAPAAGVPAAAGPRPPAPGALAGLAGALRVRRGPDGLGLAAVRRRPGRAGRVLPRRGLG